MPVNIFNNSTVQLAIRRLNRNSPSNSWVQADPGLVPPYKIYRMILTGGTNSTSAGASRSQIRIRNLVNNTTRTSAVYLAFLSAVPVYAGEIITAEESVQIQYVSSTLEYYVGKVSDEELKQVEKIHKLQRQDQIAIENGTVPAEPVKQGPAQAPDLEPSQAPDLPVLPISHNPFLPGKTETVPTFESLKEMGYSNTKIKKILKKFGWKKNG